MDPIGTKQFKDLIRMLAARGKTVLISSHLLADVEDVCDRVCILYGGQSRAVGPVGELLAEGNLTQLITDHLEEHTLAEVRGVLSRAGKGLRDVSVPRGKLESLFLRIVEEAQAQRVATGGALAGGRLAEFLQGPPAPPRGVIEELVAAAARPAAAAPAEPSPPAAPPPPARDQAEALLQDLVRPADGPLADAGDSAGAPRAGLAQPPPQAAPPPLPQADRDVLDALLRKTPPEQKKE
jgi:ABC-2 type transport system ATP-binding protein